MFWDAEPFIPSSLILDKRSPATDVGMELLGPIRHQPQIRFLLLIIVLRRGGSRKIRSVVERSLPKRATGIPGGREGAAALARHFAKGQPSVSSVVGVAVNPVRWSRSWSWSVVETRKLMPVLERSTEKRDAEGGGGGGEGGPGSRSEEEEEDEQRGAGKRKRPSDRCPSPARIKRSSSGGARQLAFRIRNMSRVANTTRPPVRRSPPPLSVSFAVSSPVARGARLASKTRRFLFAGYSVCPLLAHPGSSPSTPNDNNKRAAPLERVAEARLPARRFKFIASVSSVVEWYRVSVASNSDQEENAGGSASAVTRIRTPVAHRSANEGNRKSEWIGSRG